MGIKRRQPLYVVKRSKATLFKPTLVAECETWEVAQRVVAYLLEVSEPCSLTTKRQHIKRRAARVIYANKHWQAPDVVGPRMDLPASVFQ